MLNPNPTARNTVTVTMPSGGGTGPNGSVTVCYNVSIPRLSWIGQGLLVTLLAAAGLIGLRRRDEGSGQGNALGPIASAVQGRQRGHEE
jgi:hypothetical protein